jgi:hypothetical protein
MELLQAFARGQNTLRQSLRDPAGNRNGGQFFPHGPPNAAAAGLPNLHFAVFSSGELRRTLCETVTAEFNRAEPI